MKKILLLLLLLPQLAIASCYVVGDLKGYSSREYESFAISEDGISSKKFIIEIDGDNSSVSPSNIGCVQAGANTLFCYDKTNEDKLVIETWAVYPSRGKAVYTKSANGYGVFNGANLFVGNIKGECN